MEDKYQEIGRDRFILKMRDLGYEISPNESTDKIMWSLFYSIALQIEAIRNQKLGG
jgi:hypothetical protein